MKVSILTTGFAVAEIASAQLMPILKPRANVTLTRTATDTVTYCSECDHTGYVTTYTTVYTQLCPYPEKNYYTPVTYTITESCPEPTPTWVPGTHHVPHGYTVETTVCNVCGEVPVTATITHPSGHPPMYTGPPPVTYPLAPAPPATYPPAPAPPAPYPPPCSGPDCAVPPPAPPPAPCPGPGCPPGPHVPVPYPPATGGAPLPPTVPPYVPPYQGQASSVSVSLVLVSLLSSGLVAAGAFLL